ncbi:MAG: hypothetical protein J7K98_04285 [Candidatus Aenigmarchaeota archaeon]|nr:hypothetical protein [Candidatus Aenigmarchaeota archaeon]
MVFWTYDIRGLYEKELTPEFMHKVGEAIARLNVDTVGVGMDGRYHSPVLKKGLMSGLIMKGKNVIDLGLAPTPSVAFISFIQKTLATTITASHNPIEWNGCKIINEGLPVPSEFYQKIRDSVLVNNRKIELVEDKLPNLDAVENHFHGIHKKIKNSFDGLRVVMDFRGGIGSLWKEKFEEFGVEVIGINDEIDPFLKKDPEPKIENMEEARDAVVEWKADVGFVFDGDADRVLVIDDEGNPVLGDVLLALLAEEYKKLVTIYEGSMLFEELGFEVIRTRRGDVFYTKKMKEAKFPLAGEDNGHICFSEFQFYPDPAYTVIKLLKKIKKDGRLSDLVKKYPKYYKKIVSYRCKNPEEIVETFKRKYPEHMDIGDGIKIFFEDSWVVVRRSQTEPKVRVTVEAKDKAKLKELLKQFEVKV